MLPLRWIALAVLAGMLSGCMSDSGGLDTSLPSGVFLPSLNLGGLNTSSLPNTDAYVKQQLERRGI